MVTEKQIEDAAWDMDLLNLGTRAIRHVQVFLDTANIARGYVMVIPELIKLSELGRQAGELAEKR